MNEIEQITNLLQEAEAVLIGAGAGLSTAAGFTYDGERFGKYFFDFIDKYKFQDMYSGGFYPFDSLEEYWAYWSRYIYCNRYLDVEGTLKKDNETVSSRNKVYGELLKLMSGKNYFVITTNVDHQFQKAGFDKSRLFYTQGDYGLFQCSTPCHNSTYDNKESILKMVDSQCKYDSNGERKFVSMKIPSDLIPRCPKCGKPMNMNLRSDDTFVEDAGWNKASLNFDNFVTKHYKQKLLLIELGVGFNTPSIIKYPFWNMAMNYPQTTYVCINKGCSQDGSLEQMPKEIRSKAVCIDGDCALVLQELLLEQK